MSETKTSSLIEDDATPSARARDDLVRIIARLKLRLEVCLRSERAADAYRETLVACLADINEIARVTSAVGNSRRSE